MFCYVERPTAGVTRWWAGRDNAVLPEPALSQVTCLKTRRLPPVGCTLCWALSSNARLIAANLTRFYTQLHDSFTLRLPSAITDEYISLPAAIFESCPSLLCLYSTGFLYRFHIQATPHNEICLYAHNGHPAHRKLLSIAASSEPMPFSPDRVVLNCRTE
jgi:hypothetical protein